MKNAIVDKFGTTFTLTSEMALKIVADISYPQEGVEVITWQLERDIDLIPSGVQLSFSIPQKDMQIKWFPANTIAQSHHFLPYWGEGSCIRHGIVQCPPAACCLNLSGENQLAFAFSDATRFGEASFGGREDGDFVVKYSLFAENEKMEAEEHFALYIDRRNIPYTQALSDIGNWYARLPAYTHSLPPPSAYQPVYSTWYQYQKSVCAKELEHELPRLVEVGCKTIILDDGWQCPSSETSGMSTCGDWQPDPEKFPDMAGLVKAFHDNGIKFMLWVGTPYVGEKAKILPYFEGKYLNSENPRILDPRYPEVREYLADACEKMVRNWKVDGLKLDFLECFNTCGTDPAQANGYAGCDTNSMSDAIEHLISGIVCRLRKHNPDVLIELRQPYCGPAMWKYGNMFRSGDCAFDLLQNRVRVTDIRMLANNASVHSDMITWSPSDTLEVAALQFLNVLFSVPQISLRLQSLSDEHMRMLKFWLSFWSEHKETLLHKCFEAEHPECSYPVIRASDVDKAIIVTYKSDNVIHIPRTHRVTYLVNATHGRRIAVNLKSDASIQCSDVCGNPKTQIYRHAGLQFIDIPESGLAIITPVCQSNL